MKTDFKKRGQIMDENDYLQKAKDLIQSGEVKEALHTLKEASKLLPQSWQILLMAGQILIEIGQSEVAVSPLKKARQINDLAASYLYTDDIDLDKAQDFCLRALEIAPGDPFFLQTWQNIQERLNEQTNE